MAKLFQNLAAVTLSAAALVSAGCGGGGGSDVERFRVSGTVTFKGEPIPAGTVTFEPNVTKGNKGPFGYATITNGKFDTSSVKGTVGGPHFVRIEGTDGKVTPDKPQGSRLFNAHRVEVDLPKSNSEQKFEVPASAAEGMQADGPPV